MSYEHYYNSQIGGGSGVSSGISRVYVGSHHQRGHGIGQFLGGLLRRALPLFTRGAKAVGSEALHAGYNVLSDVARNVPVKQSLRARATESAYNLRRKAEEKLDKLMEGEGYKPKHRVISNHLLNTLGTVSSLGVRSMTRKQEKKKKKRCKSLKKKSKKINKKKKRKGSKKKSRKNKTVKHRDIFS